MRKETGLIFLEKYDEYSHKVDTIEKPNVVDAICEANDWEEQHPRNSAVVSRILYNTNSKMDKWGYNPDDNR